jgi:hypothetical protein
VGKEVKIEHGSQKEKILYHSLSRREKDSKTEREK